MGMALETDLSVSGMAMGTGITLKTAVSVSGTGMDIGMSMDIDMILGLDISMDMTMETTPIGSGLSMASEAATLSSRSGMISQVTLLISDGAWHRRLPPETPVVTLFTSDMTLAPEVTTLIFGMGHSFRGCPVCFR